MPSNFVNLIILLSIQFFQISHGYAIPKPSSCLLKERNALLKFKSGLNDPNDLLSSWVGPDCCRWVGVVCDNTTKHVIALDLHGTDLAPTLGGMTGPSLANLGGEIDPSLASLVHLQHLDLSYNNFNWATIPIFIASMQELRYLNLSYANMGGIVPFQLGNLSKLYSLDLSCFPPNLTSYLPSHLTLVDPPWLHHLVSLQYIDLTFVNVQDSPTILQSLLSLPSISSITLRNCNMTSPPQSIRPSNLSSLYLLDISENFFSNSTTIPNWISNLTGLRILNLQSYNLYGPIPPSLGKLKSLKEVDLSSNSLSGSIPLSLTKLASLKLLDLSSNSLSGSIPLSLTKLASLKLLDLSSNSLSGSIPLSLAKLASLKLLDLSNNSLSGVIPTQLFSLPNIEELSLYGNQDLSGKISDNLGQLKTLKKLSLEGQGLSGVISEAHFLKLTLLEELTISSTKSLAMRFSSGWVPPFRLVRLVIKGCNMGPGFPNWIQTQDMLHTLNLVDAGLFGRIPSWIWNFSAVSELDLSLNQLEGPVTIPLDMMTSLVHLNISGNNFFGKFELKGGPCGLSFVDLSKNNFSGRLPLSLQNCSQMFDLYLGWNKFSGSLPAWIVHSFPRLSILSLRSNRISGRLLNLSILELDLAGNYLSGTIPEGLLCGASTSFDLRLKCPGTLWSLHLEDNYLSGVLPSCMQSCTTIVILDLGNNMLEGPIPSWLPEKMPFLKFLRLRSNNFFGTIPRQVWNMNNLQILDLANNSLHGMLPESFGNFSAMKIRHNKNETFALEGPLFYSSESFVVFTKGQELWFSSNLPLLTSIDLSRNNLVGEVPKGIGDLLGLMNLNLSENSLSGRIPDSISGLLEMETLDLSINNFTGEIPQSMSKMTLLSHLNLSYNGLSGEIPVGGQLSTFSNKSFMGNLGLCGYPLASCERKKSTEGSNVNDDWDIRDELLLYAFTGLGFILGFWSVFVTILFKARWRYSYFKFIDNMRDDVYVAFVVKIKPRVKRLCRMN